MIPRYIHAKIEGLASCCDVRKSLALVINETKWIKLTVHVLAWNSGTKSFSLITAFVSPKIYLTLDIIILFTLLCRYSFWRKNVCFEVLANLIYFLTMAHYNLSPVQKYMYINISIIMDISLDISRNYIIKILFGRFKFLFDGFNLQF